MNVNDFIYEIDLDYNKDKLIAEGEKIGYVNGYRFRGGRPRPAFKTLLEARIDNVNELKKYDEINKVYKQIQSIFDRELYSITYYKVLPGAEIGPHKDPFTKENAVGFAINILLTQDEQAPLKFIIDDKHHDVFYNCILFDAGRVTHYVPTVKKDRILIRYFLRNMSYDEALKCVKSSNYLH